jgi:hypothetical protein
MPSEKELAKRGGEYKLLPEDQYKFEVAKIEVKPDQRNPYNGEVRDTLTVQLRPISFADGSPVVDIDGNDAPADKLIWDFIDPTKVGMKPQPSKARKFFTACLDLPVGSGFDLDDYQDLIGARLLGTLVIKGATADKPEQNKVTDYRALPKRPARRVSTDEVEEQAVGTLPGEKKATTSKAKKAEAADEPADDLDF